MGSQPKHILRLTLLHLNAKRLQTTLSGIDAATTIGGSIRPLIPSKVAMPKPHRAGQEIAKFGAPWLVEIILAQREYFVNINVRGICSYFFGFQNRFGKHQKIKSSKIFIEEGINYIGNYFDL